MADASAGDMTVSQIEQASQPGSLSLANLRTAADLQKKFKFLKQQRQYHERQWKLNLAFYKGRQYTFFNRKSRKIETLPIEDGEKPRYRVRITSNQITPGVLQMIAKLLKTKPQMFATPGSGSMKDLQAAQMSERLLEFWWSDLKLDSMLEEALIWSAVVGQGYWKVDWNRHAGKQMTFTMGPDGSPIMDDSMKEQFEAQMAQIGQQPLQKVVYMGDIRVSSVSPFDFYIDPSAKNFEDAKYAFEVAYLDPDALKARYNVSLPPDAITSPPDIGLPFGNMDQQPTNVRRVVTLYIIPQPTVPKGRIVTFTEGKILEDHAWDLPLRELPFFKFPGIRIPGELYDTSVVEQAIPLQKELNRTISQIVEFKNLTARPQWKAPIGSMRQRRTDEPGAMFEYNPIGPAGLGPEPIQVAALPAYVFTHLENIQARMNDIFGLTDVTNGTVPPNVEAGVAIDMLQEMATDRFAPIIRLMEMTLASAGRFMLSLAKRYYSEPRIMKIRGSGGSYQVYQFTKADLDGAVDVDVETGSGLPRTRAGRQARIMDFIDRGIIDAKDAYKYLDMADLTGLAAQFAQDEDQAFREHDKLNVGAPISQVNVYEATQTVQNLQEELAEIYGPPTPYAVGPPWDNPQAPPNPDTGQPFQSWEDFNEWAQQSVQQAAVKANFTDNHPVHMDVHSRFMKSTEYEALDVQTQEQYVQHYMSHITIYTSLPAATQPEAPKINVRLNSSIGPSTQQKILEKAGVYVTQQDTSEPPLETWITDNENEPQIQQGTENTQNAMSPADWANTMAESTGKMVQTQTQSVQAQGNLIHQAQQARHAEEKHQMEMQLMRAKLVNERKRANQQASRKPSQA